jgi:precorrin-2/cobalt-factor-2 C20-methyltransferase
MEVKVKGTFYGVGVGPGDAELLTIKAINVIREADVIIAPKTETKEGSIALIIATPFIKENAEIVKLVFPMASSGETLSDVWESNKNVILELLAAGKKVAFLIPGDPMFYSPYISVFRLMENCGFLIETIPGVPVFCAAGSESGYPWWKGLL